MFREYGGDGLSVGLGYAEPGHNHIVRETVSVGMTNKQMDAAFARIVASLYISVESLSREL